MNKRIANPSFAAGQRGASSLFLTVILVMVVMLLAVTASVISNTQFKLASNIQFENNAFNKAEGAIAEAENWLSTGTNSRNASFTTYAPGSSLYPGDYLSTNNLDPLTMTWADSNSTMVDGKDSQRYLIEKVGADNQPLGTEMEIGGRAHTVCQKVDVFRVSARGTSARGTTKFAQTAYSVPSC